jgi:hypothetical protein
MPGRREFDKHIAAIIPEWNKAEADIKIAEQLEGKVVFPSIKELRYSGRRIIDALNAAKQGDYKTAIEYLIDAKFDCIRARHDAIDVTVATVAAELAVVSKKVGFDSVLRAFPDYPKLRQLVIEAQEKIVNSRANRNSREAIYATVEGVPFAELVRMFRGFQSSEPVMKSLARKDRLARLLTVIAFVAATGLAAIQAWPQIRSLFE